MLKMTGGGLGKCCHIPGRYLNAKKKEHLREQMCVCFGENALSLTCKGAEQKLKSVTMGARIQSALMSRST